MHEIWKDVPNTNGQYQVSNLGNARSMFYHTRNWNRIYRVRELLPKPNPRGYMHISILFNGKRVSKFLHKIVAILFIPNPLNKPQVNHIDGNKANNSASNLEWVTAKENQQHAIKNGLRDPHSPKGISKHRKPVVQYSLNGYFINAWESVYDAGDYYKIKPNAISSCASGHSKSYKGYMWKYIEDNEEISLFINPYVNGKGKNQKTKGVSQYSLDGVIVREWKCAEDVAKHFGCSRWLIRSRCNGNNQGEAFGFKWRFHNE